LETSPVLKYLLFSEKVKRQWWVNRIFEEREKYGEFHTLFPQLLKQPIKFFEYMRVSPETFFYILEKIRPYIEKYCSFRKCIIPE